MLLGVLSLANSGLSVLAEFGIIMMLFLVGLDLLPSTLWTLRGPIFGTGTAQVVVTTLAFMTAGMLIGHPWQSSLAIGFCLTLSSTAIALPSLIEKGLFKTAGGQTSFAVLLFQDIAVIPMIAVMPFLGVHPIKPAETNENGFTAWLRHSSPFIQALFVAIAVAFVVLVALFFLPHVFRWVANSHLREVFTATTLAIVLGVALLMEVVGLSPALGAFIAGVILAESPFRRQIETDLEPFKGLLMGLFFVGVGASIDFSLIGKYPLFMLGLLGGFLLIKIVALAIVGWFSKLRPSDNVLFSTVLSQGDEFAFVLLAFAANVGAITGETKQWLIATVAMAMATTPVLMTVQSLLIQPLFADRIPKKKRHPDIVNEGNPVILVGFGRFGHIVGRMLKAHNIGTTVLDHDADQIQMLDRYGLKAYYGDATRLDLLVKAGIEKAKLLIIAIDHEESAIVLADIVKQHFPYVSILARAEHRVHAYQLIRHGVKHVHRAILGSALEMGEEALTMMGVPPEISHHTMETFHEHEYKSMYAMANLDENTRSTPPWRASIFKPWNACFNPISMPGPRCSPATCKPLATL